VHTPVLQDFTKEAAEVSGIEFLTTLIKIFRTKEYAMLSINRNGIYPKNSVTAIYSIIIPLREHNLIIP